MHEERQEDPTWGQPLKPRYREMILGGELTPVGRLSAAFLMPKSPLHLQFAYFEAGLLVDFLVERYGHGTVVQLLEDLGEGGEINTLLERRVAPLSALEPAFEAYAREQARGLAPGLAWDKPRVEPRWRETPRAGIEPVQPHQLLELVGARRLPDRRP